MALVTCEKVIMTDTLLSLCQLGKLRSSYLLILVIKRIDSDTFIIADKTKVAILDTSEGSNHGNALRDGCWFKLIKCTAEENGLVKLNKSFKPIISPPGPKIGKIEKEVNALEQTYTKKTVSKIIDFKTIEAMENNATIKEVTLKVISKSRIIHTKNGNYQICTVKDSQGNKTSINLYSKHLDALELFKIYTLLNIRRGEVVKNDQKELRLHTTYNTTISEGSSSKSSLFMQVRNGDATMEGTLIGFGEITTYSSCPIDLKKLDDTDQCSKCMKVIEEAEKIEDFRTTIYVEPKQEKESDETDVMEVTMFKRALPNIETKDAEEKLTALVNTKIIVDYNIDNDGRFIAISVDLIE